MSITFCFTDPLDWEALRAFHAVSSAGSLREAARRTGLSAATLGRRITSLERACGMTLVHRGRKGYRLTDDGRAVFNSTRQMSAAVDDIERRGEQDLPVVRITAGTWMSRYLVARSGQLTEPEDTFAIEWLSANSRADIGRRVAHVGIRNSRPVESDLAGRRISRVAFAVYRCVPSEAIRFDANHSDEPTAAVGDGDLDWLLAGTEPRTPSARWTLAQRGRVAARVSEATLLLPLIIAGTGRAVLPCFVGDSESGIERDGGLLAALEHEQWLVTHHDDRHLDAVRRVIERIVTLVGNDADLFNGERA